MKSNGSLKLAIATLKNQAKKALMQKVVYLDYPPPFLLLKLFDSLITPILEYGCQIWGHMALNNTEIELIHRKFCKFILNMPSSATNISIYGELGRIPLKIRRNILYWLHLSTSHNISPILWACYRTHQQFNSLWLLHIRSILNLCGLSYIYDEASRLEPAEVIFGVKECLYDQYLQQWREDITHSRKMRTYQIFKINYNLEPYLFLPSHLRTTVARFTTSCHSLAIDTAICHKSTHQVIPLL